MDFPASYHGKKQFTDYVRRRRWYRKCRLSSSGPWQELGSSKIIDISLQPEDDSIDCNITVWAVAVNGDVLLRKGVSQSTPMGLSWEHVASEQPLISISCSLDGKVWAIGKNGSAFYRFGITKDLPQGRTWQTVEAPPGSSFKQISTGQCGIWALDTNGRLAVRREITTTFPEGTHWQILSNVANDPPHTEGNIGFKYVSVGEQVWAVSISGYVCRRCGITSSTPLGTGWNIGIPVS